MNEVPMMERTDSKGNMGNQRWMMELEHCLLQKLLPMMMMMKRKERSVTADTRHPVHGKVVNQNIENRLVVTTRRTSIATVTHQQVVPAAVRTIVGADITAAVLVGNIEEERMMVRIVITI
jgi:DNA-binding transcriptional regulator YdaS (Cro superfamily)